jgi:ring-1,2-phenylacetyl-CoA epoxidase subunit PaaC
MDSTDYTDNAYTGLVEADSDARWAFGGGFVDPLAGLDVGVPADVEGSALAAYCLMLGDDALVLAQRLNQWCTRGPELEEEVALANVALDLLGQTRLLYARAAAADPAAVPRLPEGSPVPPEDRLAFFRDPGDFRCVPLVELPNGDFALTVVRLTVFACWRVALLEALQGSRDPVLAAVAERGAKELRYHRDYAGRWLLTLAGGTAESRSRAEAALQEVWPHAAALDGSDEVTEQLVGQGVAADPRAVWQSARVFLDRLLAEAQLPDPDGSVATQSRADHTPWLTDLVVELQQVARAHPMGRW